MANLNLSQFTEKLFVADADHTFIWDTVGAISKRVSRNSWLSGTTADFHLGLADAASPVAQTISVQSVVAGTTNTAGANLSINGSQGTGTGAGGALLLRTAPAGSSGTTQNALVTAVAITSAGNVGIGTTAPTTPLTIQANSGGSAFNILGSYGNFLFQCGGVYGVNLSSQSNTSTDGFLLGTDSGSSNAGAMLRLQTKGVTRAVIDYLGNVGIGTTSPTSKLHVAGNSSPGIAIENTVATGYSELLFKNTVATGSSIFLNGSAQSGYGGNSSLNIYSSNGPLAFHTATVTNALSIAQSGAITYTGSVLSASGSSGALGAAGVERTYINQNGSRIFGFDSGLFLLGAAYSGANPALKRNGTEIQARLADDLAFTFIQGKLKTDTAYTGTVVAATGYITIYDSTGTAYRVPCAV